MRALLALVVFAVSCLSYGETIHEKNLKQEMIGRADALIAKMELLKVDLRKPDAPAACLKIKDIFALYPDHVKAIGTHLDILKEEINEIKNESLSQLIAFHRQSLVCDQGKGSEYLDPDQLEKDLRTYLSSLKHQKKVIAKADASFENEFSYEYQF